MTTKSHSRAAAIGLALAAGAAGAGLALANPAALPVAYRAAFFAGFSPVMGCTLLLVLHRTTGGQWSRGIAPMLRAGSRMTPWAWLFAIPMLAMPVHPNGVPGRGYDSLPFVAARTAAYAAVFFAVRWANDSGPGDEADPRRNPRPWAGPVSLIVLFFCLTLVSDDWIESLEPGWHSTAFGAVWIVDTSVSALALCLLLAVGRGASPSAAGPAGRKLGLDWGDLLMAAIVFCAYITFAQFLIIWSGNLPREISWYVRRETGGWGLVMPAVALLGFAAPFGILLSRRQKSAARGIAAAAAMVFLAQVADIVWMIAPAQRAGGPAALLLEADLASLAVAAVAWRLGASAAGTSP